MLRINNILIIWSFLAQVSHHVVRVGGFPNGIHWLPCHGLDIVCVHSHGLLSLIQHVGLRLSSRWSCILVACFDIEQLVGLTEHGGIRYFLWDIWRYLLWRNFRIFHNHLWRFIEPFVDGISSRMSQTFCGAHIILLKNLFRFFQECACFLPFESLVSHARFLTQASFSS